MTHHGWLQLDNLTVETARDLDNLTVEAAHDLDNLTVEAARDLDSLTVETARDLDRFDVETDESRQFRQRNSRDKEGSHLYINLEHDSLMKACSIFSLIPKILSYQGLLTIHLDLSCS